jgi:hypothetical protein
MKNEEANGRRQIALFAVGVDAGDQLPQTLAPLLGNLLQAIPEQFFQADTGAAASNGNRTLVN